MHRVARSTPKNRRSWKSASAHAEAWLQGRTVLFVPALLLLLTAASHGSVEAREPRRLCEAALTVNSLSLHTITM